jgi:lysozyme
MTSDPAALACDIARPFEGLRLSPYQDPTGTWTIGYGATYRADGSPVTANTPPMTVAQAEALLEAHMETCVADVDSVVTCPLNPNQTAALADFVYNEGFGAFRSSTLLKLLNQGDIAGASEQFQRWDLAGGEVLPGLVRRRAAERALFETPVTPTSLKATP